MLWTPFIPLVGFAHVSLIKASAGVCRYGVCSVMIHGSATTIPIVMIAGQQQ